MKSENFILTTLVFLGISLTASAWAVDASEAQPTLPSEGITIHSDFLKTVFTLGIEENNQIQFVQKEDGSYGPKPSAFLSTYKEFLRSEAKVLTSDAAMRRLFGEFAKERKRRISLPEHVTPEAEKWFTDQEFRRIDGIGSVLQKRFFNQAGIDKLTMLKIAKARRDELSREKREEATRDLLKVFQDPRWDSPQLTWEMVTAMMAPYELKWGPYIPLPNKIESPSFWNLVSLETKPGTQKQEQAQGDLQNPVDPSKAPTAQP